MPAWHVLPEEMFNHCIHNCKVYRFQFMSFPGCISSLEVAKLVWKQRWLVKSHKSTEGNHYCGLLRDSDCWIKLSIKASSPLKMWTHCFMYVVGLWYKSKILNSSVSCSHNCALNNSLCTKMASFCKYIVTIFWKNSTHVD